MWLEAAGIAVSTLASEDLASIAAGVLAREGRLTLPVAIGASVAGVYVGDLALWGLGRVLGARVASIPALRRHADRAALHSLARRLDDHLALTVVATRFLPGTRRPSMSRPAYAAAARSRSRSGRWSPCRSGHRFSSLRPRTSADD
jgi:membrane protein DedA with SNARE-associated domain